MVVRVEIVSSSRSDVMSVIEVNSVDDSSLSE